MAGFPYDAKQLQDLFDDRGNVTQLEKLGGVHQIVNGLKVDPRTGLCPQDEVQVQLI